MQSFIVFRQFCWTDDKGKRGKETGPQYIDLVTLHIQKIISDESIFPTKFGRMICSNFISNVIIERDTCSNISCKLSEFPMLSKSI